MKDVRTIGGPNSYFGFIATWRVGGKSEVRRFTWTWVATMRYEDPEESVDGVAIILRKSKRNADDAANMPAEITTTSVRKMDKSSQVGGVGDGDQVVKKGTPKEEDYFRRIHKRHSQTKVAREHKRNLGRNSTDAGPE